MQRKQYLKLDFEESVKYNLVHDKNKSFLDYADIDCNRCGKFMEELTDDNGHIKAIKSERWLELGYTNIQYVLLQMALYTAPTTELIQWLDKQITDNPELVPDAIEICCGHGVIGRELDIPITDSKNQLRPEIRSLYNEAQQPVIQYPDDVEQLTAVEAIRKYRPEFVIASYATHKWKHGDKTGNMWGVDTTWVIRNCHKYFLIGNENIHDNGDDPAFKMKHETYSFPWLITRGDISKARIWAWEQKQWRG